VSTGDAGELRERVRGIIGEMDPSLPVAELFTTRELVSRATALPAFRTQLLAGFAAVALMLALAGVYAVMTFHVAQRRREIGVRLALGATAGEVRQLVVTRGARLVALGCVMGIVIAVPSMEVLRDVLFGVTPEEPLPYVVAPAILLVTAVLATYLPARRATAVDPVESMRTE
jgi:putative ABC transport system permease protein